jgi:uncharacterized protein involved in outer membrane biogenesis
VIAGVIVGVVVAVYTVDVNTLIAPIRDRVKAATGRELTIRGGADLALSMRPKLILKDVSLGNAPWGSAPQMVTAQRLELQVALLPLLSRQFELVELSLVGPVIALETDAKGRRNWDFPETNVAGPAGGPSSPSSAAAVFGAGNVVITDGTLTYRDGKTGDVTRVVIERFFVRARDPNLPVAAEFRGKVEDVAVSLEGTLGPIASLLEKRWPYPVSLKGTVQGRPTDVAAKVKADGDVYTLDELTLKFGANTVTGDFAIVTGGSRAKLRFKLATPTLVLADLPVAAPATATSAAPTPAADGTSKGAAQSTPQSAPARATPGVPPDPGARAASGSQPASPPSASSSRIFADTPIEFGLLRTVDADGSLAIGKLVLPKGRTVDNLRVALTLAAGRLDMPTIQGEMLGGSLAGGATVDASRPGDTSLTLRLNGNNLSLGAILAAIDKPRDVRGGKSDVTMSLAMRGRSPHQWASTASGNFRLVVGPATLVNTKGKLDGSIERLFDAVNPFRSSDPSTDLVCAVIRLPLANGIARVDRSIAMETNKLGVSASGTLDLRNETIDFSFAPRVHKDIPIQIPNLAQLVRLSGPIMAPEVKVDAVGSAAAIASIGAAVGTGGLSAIGQALFSMVQAGGDSPCEVAMGRGSSPSAKPGATSAKPGTAPAKPATAPSMDDIGKAICRIFGK